ncbi:MAG: class I SAM-dependent methyltransferase [Verrucomicrobiales bacterium]|nr:class I SAM-dependent methyltransferase [Verrucomicrobiales bacterium]
MKNTLDRYFREAATLPGWFFRRSCITWDCLLRFQEEQEIGGDFLEIGVWRGRSALLAALHAGEGDTFLLVDPAIHEKTLETLGASTTAKLKFLRECSSALADSDWLTDHANSCRWIHIDGEHTGTRVYDDICHGVQLLSEEGILVIDDFFSPIWPQITKASFDYCHHYPDELRLFLCGDNKGYFCRPSQLPLYKAYLLERLHGEMSSRDEKDFSICKTTLPDDMDCCGIVNRFKDRDYVGPDWDPDKLV